MRSKTHQKLPKAGINSRLMASTLFAAVVLLSSCATQGDLASYDYDDVYGNSSEQSLTTATTTETDKEFKDYIENSGEGENAEDDYYNPNHKSTEISDWDQYSPVRANDNYYDYTRENFPYSNGQFDRSWNTPYYNNYSPMSYGQYGNQFFNYPATYGWNGNQGWGNYSNWYYNMSSGPVGYGMGNYAWSSWGTPWHYSSNWAQNSYYSYNPWYTNNYFNGWNSPYYANSYYNNMYNPWGNPWYNPWNDPWNNNSWAWNGSPYGWGNPYYPWGSGYNGGYGGGWFAGGGNGGNWNGNNDSGGDYNGHHNNITSGSSSNSSFGGTDMADYSGLAHPAPQIRGTKVKPTPVYSGEESEGTLIASQTHMAGNSWSTEAHESKTSNDLNKAGQANGITSSRGATTNSRAKAPFRGNQYYYHEQTYGSYDRGGSSGSSDEYSRGNSSTYYGGSGNNSSSSNYNSGAHSRGSGNSHSASPSNGNYHQRGNGSSNSGRSSYQRGGSSNSGSSMSRGGSSPRSSSSSSRSSGSSSSKSSSSSRRR